MKRLRDRTEDSFDDPPQHFLADLARHFLERFLATDCAQNYEPASETQTDDAKYDGLPCVAGPHAKPPPKAATARPSNATTLRRMGEAVWIVSRRNSARVGARPCRSWNFLAAFFAPRVARSICRCSVGDSSRRCSATCSMVLPCGRQAVRLRQPAPLVEAGDGANYNAEAIGKPKLFVWRDFPSGMASGAGIVGIARKRVGGDPFDGRRRGRRGAARVLVAPVAHARRAATARPARRRSGWRGSPFRPCGWACCWARRAWRY